MCRAATINLLVYSSYPEVFHPFWGLFLVKEEVFGCNL
jgi:hypothetical protein